MDKNTDITEKYLFFNKLKYEIHIATQHTYNYPQCSWITRWSWNNRWWWYLIDYIKKQPSTFRLLGIYWANRWRRHILYTQRNCNYITRSWTNYGVTVGMNSWKGNAKNIPPSDEWSARQGEMLRDLYKIYKKCAKPNNKPIYIYLKSLGTNKYLQSDTIGYLNLLI